MDTSLPTMEYFQGEWFTSATPNSLSSALSDFTDAGDSEPDPEDAPAFPDFYAPTVSANKPKTTGKVAVVPRSKLTELSSSVVKKGDRRVKIYERDLNCNAVERARQIAEDRTQDFARQCRDEAGVTPNRRNRVTAEGGEVLSKKRQDRRRELNQNSAKVARKRGSYYTEALEDMVVTMEERLRDMVNERVMAETIHQSLSRGFEGLHA